MRFIDLTDAGRVRNLNQDYVYATDSAIGNLPNLFLVADGMGGHNAGDYASKNAVQMVVEEIKSCEDEEPVTIMEQAITSANHSLYIEASIDSAKSGMGTTFVAATILGEHLYVANVGDSRLYVLDDKQMNQVTRDHSFVEEMVRRGEMPESETFHHPQKHMITRAVGAEEQVKIDFFDVHLQGNETILICTDGLTNMIEDDDIYSIMSSEQTIEKKAEKLLDTANQNGGRDNITVVVIEPFSDEVKAC